MGAVKCVRTRMDAQESRLQIESNSQQVRRETGKEKNLNPTRAEQARRPCTVSD